MLPRRRNEFLRGMGWKLLILQLHILVSLSNIGSFNSHNCLYNYVCFYRWGNRGTERLSNWAKVTEQTCNGVTALVPSSLAPEDFLKPTDNSESIKQ